MRYLFYFLFLIYALAGLGTAIYVTSIIKGKGSLALLAGLFWPLFWVTGQQQKAVRRSNNKNLLK